MEPSIVFLMYHELELSGRSLCHNEPGYVRYVLGCDDFKLQMGHLKQMGWRGLSVSEALTFSTNAGVAITFDDGCETDLISAAPILRESNFGATFYITVGFLGKRGYLTSLQLRELSDLGFEIGCHSMTHPYLPDLSRERLHKEIAAPKAMLEQITGKPVKHFSCPGGRWNPTVSNVAATAGYESVATSRNRANSLQTSRFSLGRVAIMRNTDIDGFWENCRGHGLWRLRLKDLARSSGKRLMGNSTYDKVRTLLLKKEESRTNR